ncbi:hypothetical protein ORI89_03045 [Sphingobacterium sp. UT-1RO-CII-1]|uniref:hypothetical protein n=1 Tax=Sphingobacterium sp. UT-1RO-CII-1 TaxID=2995225 RepID=UPI00227C1A5D|nr:hypothetical protein [Sphingobacterium sp. UT-1RO-CII-1]MCY4778613.1 hypothetical protein [Sphingobacterium sp. UT-1RO-CII-1]
MSSVIERVKLIADAERISLTAFEASIGASKGVFSRALNNGTDVQSKWLVKVIEEYPDYSAHWLMTGEGAMLRNVYSQGGANTSRLFHDAEINYETLFEDLSVSDQLKVVKDLLQTSLQNHSLDISVLKQEIFDLKKEIISLRGRTMR